MVLKKYFLLAFLGLSLYLSLGRNLYAQENKFSVNIMWGPEWSHMATFDRSIIQGGEELWFLNQLGGIHATYSLNGHFEFLLGFRVAEREFTSMILFTGQEYGDLCLLGCQNFTPYNIFYRHWSLEIPVQLKYFPFSNQKFMNPYVLSEASANFLVNYEYNSALDSQLENKEFPSRGFWGTSLNTGIGLNTNFTPKFYFNLEPVIRVFNFQKVDKVLAWNRKENFESYNPVTITVRGYLGFRF